MLGFIKRNLYKIIQKSRTGKFTSVGTSVWISGGGVFHGNIEVGTNCIIGKNGYFVSTVAAIKIHDYVVFGPCVRYTPVIIRWVCLESTL